jgi:poly-gamma-glutamate synthesis protein (capsule biosynthesis protein)
MPILSVEAPMPFVPVVGFWSTDTSIGRDDLVAALRGQSDRFRRVLVPTADRAAIAAALGITIADSVESVEPADIVQAVRRKAVLGLLRASDVSYRVRALGIGPFELFGNDRLRKLDDWPLTITVTAQSDAVWDQRATWTLVAGGDSFTDRGIYERVVNRGKGIDYPFAGGTARVTGHYCCGPYVTPGHPVPSYQLGGPKGVVRAMTRDADLAIANHESPIADDWVFHLHGFIFSGKPGLTEIFTRAGIDYLSLANNHIRDFGASGVMDTRKWLKRYGIAFSGAGKDLAQARDFATLEVKGVRVAIIPCVAVAPFAWAGEDSAGATPCKNRYLVPDIRRANREADVVIVFPHWGVEYDRDPLNSQRKLAAKWVKVGADLVLGAHSHVAGAIEEIEGAPIFYSLGNFIFDQNWATYTMESVLLEATFHGDRLVQLRMHPFLTHDQAQPNLLDPTRDDGKALLKAVRRSSFIDW